METSKVEEKIYKALLDDKILIKKLGEGKSGIYHLQAPAGKDTRYPLIVYSPISDVPFFYADNKILANKLSIRIHIVTTDGEYAEIAKEVNEIMLSLGARKFQTIPYVNGNQKTLIVDYRMRVLKEEPIHEDSDISTDTDTCHCHCSTLSGSVISEEQIDDIINDALDD